MLHTGLDLQLWTSWQGTRMRALGQGRDMLYYAPEFGVYQMCADVNRPRNREVAGSSGLGSDARNSPVLYTDICSRKCNSLCSQFPPPNTCGLFNHFPKKREQHTSWDFWGNLLTLWLVSSLSVPTNEMEIMTLFTHTPWGWQTGHHSPARGWKRLEAEASLIIITRSPAYSHGPTYDTDHHYLAPCQPKAT